MTKTKLNPPIEKIIFTYEQILEGINLCANWLNNLIKKNEEYVAISVLKGSLPFAGHLLPLLKGNIIFDFFAVTSYRKGSTQTIPQIILDTTNDVENKNVIIIEDIVDSGTTLNFLIDILKKRKAKKIILVSLFKKNKHKLKNLDKVSFFSPLTLPNGWVVGFGLDYDNKWRNLSYIGLLKKVEE